MPAEQKILAWNSERAALLEKATAALEARGVDGTYQPTGGKRRDRHRQADVAVVGASSHCER